MERTRKLLAAAFALTCLWTLGAAGPAAAGVQTSSDLLLPYFVVDLENPGGATTLFAVGNPTAETVPILISVYSNWGIPLLEVDLVLEADQVRTVNLRDWIAGGNLPGRAADERQRRHLTAALSGEASPVDGLYYSTQEAPGRAVGYVIVQAMGRHPDVLFGDYFIVDPAQDFAQGELLINLDRSLECREVCFRHALRFLLGGGFDGGTRIVVWTGRRGTPSEDPYYPASNQVTAFATIYSEAGDLLAERPLDLLPVASIDVADLGLGEPFGWIDLEVEQESYVGVDYSASRRYTVGFESYCLKLREGPGIRIEKATNGHDADTAPGPQLAVGSAVAWTYRVTNSGGVPLSGVTVTDDQGVAVSCPQSTLAAGESMTCTGDGVAAACQYRNVGSVIADTPDGGDVRDSDPSHYFGGGAAAVDIEKATNGHDADAAPGPQIPVGGAVAWSYVVTNSGASALSNVAVTDDQGVAVSCPKTSLAPGESMTCTASGVAVFGQYRNVGTVTAQGACGETVSDSDASHYHGDCPDDVGIDIEKATNGHDADTAPGPQLAIGSAVAWTYVVTNTGASALSNVAVTDDRGVAVSCPKSSLGAGESMTCTAAGTAVAGQYRNVGTVTATCACGVISDSDPSHYYGACQEQPAIDLEKKTNGHDADTAPGPQLAVGSAVTWTYRVRNTGDSALSNVAVTDDQGVAVSCPATSLAPGASMTCTGNGTATAGQYRNVGTATATSACGATVWEDDPSHYFGEEPPTGGQGCTPGYWKNHTDSWPPTGYDPGQTVESVFSAASAYPAIGSASLLAALDFGGGGGVEGGARILMRAAVAALLDASHPQVAYPRTPGSVIADVDGALASGDRATMLALASALDADNNLGCPLN